jgi:hypothetical protein
MQRNRIVIVDRTLHAALFLLGVVVFLQACAGLVQREASLSRTRPAKAAVFFETLDDAIAEYGVSEGADFKVPGFPYLRTNRFLAATGDRIQGDDQFNAWLDRMLRLDRTGRKKEILNLPENGLATLKDEIGGFENRSQLLSLISKHSAMLLEADRRHPAFRERLQAEVDVPDEYSTAMRIFGLYPIAAIPVSIATHSAYGTFRKWHRQPLEELETLGTVSVYRPAEGEGDIDRNVSELFISGRIDAIGLVDLDAPAAAYLARTFAPVISQDVVADYDRFGAVEWVEGTVSINPEKPTVYYYITYSILNRQPVLQLNYAFWYSERNGEKAPAIEKGPLDGITFRISLDQTGRPVMADVMNNCGCYYFNIPRREMVKDIHPSADKLYPFVPTWMPEAFPRQPISLRVNSGWHQIEKVYTAPIPESAREYRLVPYDELESLPHADRSRESVFTPQGIMKDSKRIEPYIFFSMGIPKVGYMRQRNHHAIKLVGRSHFTDTDIYDRYFTFE